MYNVPKIVDALGLEVVPRGDNAQGMCPMHERITGDLDHNPSWYIHLETGQHICFSCGYKGNLIQLVCDVKELYRTDPFTNTLGYDYSAGKGWLSGASDISVDELTAMLAKIPQYITPPIRPLPMSEARLAIYVAPTEDALASRRISAEAAEHYGVLWNQNTHTWILPVRDAVNNNLMGWQEKGTVDRTFKNRPAGMVKSRTLFGVHQQQEDLAIVVESPLDCLRIYTAGYLGAVAIMGAIMSEDQAKLLRASDKIIAAFDNPNIDTAGKKASEQIRTWARKYGMNLFFFNYGDSNKKDPGDMTDEEIAWGIENAKSALLGEAAYVYGNPQAVSG